jgi:hypothetical protein
MSMRYGNNLDRGMFTRPSIVRNIYTWNKGKIDFDSCNRIEFDNIEYQEVHFFIKQLIGSDIFIHLDRIDSTTS